MIWQRWIPGFAGGDPGMSEIYQFSYFEISSSKVSGRNGEQIDGKRE
jgi:hypothetical protein